MKKKDLIDEKLKIYNTDKSIKIRARERKTFISLYLDLRKRGITNHHNLNIQISLNPKLSIEDKNHLQYALLFRDEKEKEFIEKENDFKLKDHSKEINFIEYFEMLIKAKEKDGVKKNTIKPWKNTYNHLKKFTDGKVLFKDIDSKFCKDFVKYLDKQNLSPDTRHTYFARLKSALNIAVDDDKIINTNPAISITVEKGKSKREFLTIEELEKLSDTECFDEQTKRAFIFACFTGLRLSDIKALSFENIKNGYLDVKIVKNEDYELFKLNSSAKNIIEYQMKDGIVSGNLFRLRNDSNVNMHIKKWYKDTGIQKHITFHCARHTFATLHITYGTDIYTLSKLMGHKDVKTTQIYAKLIDKKKDQAIDRLPLINLDYRKSTTTD